MDRIFSRFRRDADALFVSGDVDIWSKDAFHVALLPLEHEQSVTIDFSGVGFADATALGALVQLQKKMLRNGGSGTITVRGLRPTVMRLFRMNGLDATFDLQMLTTPT